jgi:hypothetical protein
MSRHAKADASQKFTWPTVNCVDPALTVAVNVITVPGFAVVTALVPEVTASVVVVAVLVCAGAICPRPPAMTMTTSSTPSLKHFRSERFRLGE